MPRRTLWRLTRRVAVAVILLLLLSAAAFLPFAGRYLVREDPLEPVDAIFVLAGARVERWLEAWELTREGATGHVLLSPGRRESAHARLDALGIPYPSEAELARDALVQLGLPAARVSILPGDLDNTAEEAVALRRHAASAGWRRILVITSKYHTRRTRFAFRREFDDSGVVIFVRASRHDASVPERWWTRRADVRFVVSELQKLPAYWLTGW